MNGKTFAKGAAEIAKGEFAAAGAVQPSGYRSMGRQGAMGKRRACGNNRSRIVTLPGTRRKVDVAAMSISSQVPLPEAAASLLKQGRKQRNERSHNDDTYNSST